MSTQETTQPQTPLSDIDQASKILYPPQPQPIPGLDALVSLGKRLSKADQFGYARKIYLRAREHQDISLDPAVKLKLIQQQAVCTYKDEELPLDVRLERALTIIELAGSLSISHDEQKETLGISGAIHKRMWEVDNQKEHLEAALDCYKRGYELGVMSAATGYTGINAAFIYDVLAWQDEESVLLPGETPAHAKHLRDAAKVIRTRITTELSELVKTDEALEQDPWVRATLAEAYLGLKEYDQAKVWLDKYKEISPVAWERKTLAQQLASLTRFQDGKLKSWSDIKGSRAWELLSDFLGNDNGLLAGFVGKLGVALSGGGFRASLFHIGVLAKLAELDLLRHVEAISCVSGGSIIGAYYYLELQQLLQRTPDIDVRCTDYIGIVERIQKKFLDGVQTNVRTRVLANPWVNLRMIVSGKYSRTEYVGDLYESKLFSLINYESNSQPHYLADLKVKPVNAAGQLDRNFNPKESNWSRQAKVPILILNATTLNTGHNWQFTASWMGEPPSYIDTEIDSNYRLRRLYYSQAPTEPVDYQKVKIGQAVAASSCVPGLFEPITLPYLYDKKIVRLVDGGVQDNQGVTGLLDQGCNVLIVSDASGQMEAQDEAKSNTLGVLLRTNSIVMSRVRESQFQELDARRRTSLLRGLIFVHLKKDLGDGPVDWIGCEEPYNPEYDIRPPASASTQTSYGISKAVQKCLAAIRTDLDSFSEAEAFALMTSGYLMTEQGFFEGRIKGFPGPTAQELPQKPNWEFLKIREVMEAAQLTDDDKVKRAKDELIRQLAAGASRGFKIWKLKPVLRYAALVLILLLAFVAFSLMYGLSSLFAPAGLGGVLGAIIIVLLLKKLMGRIVWLRDVVVRIIIGTSIGTIGWFAALIHLWTFDRWFKGNGRLGRFVVEQSAKVTKEPH